MQIILIMLLVVILSGGLFLFIQFKKFTAVSKGIRIPTYDNPKKALLVIDLQKDLTDSDGKAIINLKQTDNAIGSVNRIIENYRQFDMSPIYIRHEVEPNFIINLITRGVLAEGSPGAEIDFRIKVVNDKIFVKHVMDAFSNSNFEHYLKENSINQLFLTGIDAEACVDRTLRAALSRGYLVTVISDAIATKNDARLQKKFNEFKNLGVAILTTEELLTLN
jgi:nicotinamidase-related amidase